VSLKATFYTIENSWISVGLGWQSLILFFGGLLLFYKSTSEIHEKPKTPNQDENKLKAKNITSPSKAIVQILLIDFIFSIDSILTAVGMTNGIGDSPKDARLYSWL
tara:strand:+ start:1972 stop:2289 length:318 start_codon:yes stop_codon:yes gene_type:complete